MSAFDVFFQLQNRIAPMHIYICFHDKDKTALETLENNLKPKVRRKQLTYWSRNSLLAGERHRERKNDELAKADVTIVLISSDYMALDGDLEQEYEAILARSEEGMMVIPVVVRATNSWKDDPIGEFTAAFEGNPIGSQANPDDAWDQVMDWIKRALSEYKAEIQSARVTRGKSQKDLVIQILTRMEKKIDAIDDKLDHEFSRIMNKLHDSMDFQNEVYQNLMMLGERIDARVEDSQEQWQELHGQLESVMKEAIGRLSQENAAKAEEVLALLAPSEELSKGRKFLKAIKLKLPVIAVTVALLAAGAPVATTALVAALSRSVEYETTADGAIQQLIKLLRNPGAPILPMGQS
jgi:uncharacterized protein YicC (UPF0701 family)